MKNESKDRYDDDDDNDNDNDNDDDNDNNNNCDDDDTDNNIILADTNLEKAEPSTCDQCGDEFLSNAQAKTYRRCG